MKALIFLIFTNFIQFFVTQSDGNPHQWDRNRRCDNEDYAVTCGICEGIGGIPTSDSKDDIKLTTCTPIALAKDVDMKTVHDPYFPDVFPNSGFYEVLIGIKNDPFCFKSFPGPDSTGDHCYTPQQGTFYYDWKNYQLRIDYTKNFPLKNTTLTTFHTKGDMWVINDLNLVTQCICINPGRRYNITLYPVNPKFLKEESRYIGREKLGIEYIWEERIVDHWVRGPHHVWVDVETGHIIRMWQPFNGLEVFDPTKWTFTADNSLFAVPPQVCTKSGVFWRIGCDDNGYYIGDKKALSFLS